MTNLKVGDEIRFDHFGGKDRLGKVVKVTAKRIYVEWLAPSSGVVRVVPISLDADALRFKNVRHAQDAQTQACHGCGRPVSATCGLHCYQTKADSCSFQCATCGAEPEFRRRASWGFNMADAYCPNDPKHISFKTKEVK